MNKNINDTIYFKAKPNIFINTPSCSVLEKYRKNLQKRKNNKIVKQ